MINPVRILGANGQPLPPSRPKYSALNSPDGAPYDGASRTSAEMADWRPYLGSPDNEVNIYRDRIVSRVRDLVRNDGWGSGIVTRILDNAVGANFRPVFKPDYRALKLMTGKKAFDAAWAEEYSRAAEAAYRIWSMDAGRYCDLERKKTVPQMLRLAFRHKLVDGDALAIMHYRPDRLGHGKARYATTVQIVDPDRLCNPQQSFDLPHIRGGVEIDDDSAPCAFHFRKAHIGDWWSGAKTMTWERIPRETDWGRPIVVHDFDSDRAAQHRGVSLFAPIMQRLKMLVKYDETELQAAILNAVFAAYIESPFDPAMVESAMGGDPESLGAYQDERIGFHNDRRLSLNDGSRIPILFPGEKINAVTASRPNSNFAAFESAVHRNLSAATGLSTPQITQNWSDINYSSARAAMLEAWKTLHRRRFDFAIGFASPITSCLIEELHSFNELPLPSGAPDFIEARTAYCRANWMGPGRGWLDPVAEKKGAVLGLDAGFSTMEREVAEAEGEDWEEVLDQRAREIEAFAKRSIPLPEWGMDPAAPADQTIKDPQEK